MLTSIAFNQVLCGDCREVLRQVPDGCVDFVFTDPPFGISESIDHHRNVNPLKYHRNRGGALERPLHWDRFNSLDEYLKFTDEWASEAIRTLRRGGHLVSFFDRLKVSYLCEILVKHGCKLRQPLYWIIQNPVPRGGRIDFMGAVGEMVWATKGTFSREVSTFNYELGQHPNYIVAPTVQGRERVGHVAQKPEATAVWLIDYLSKPDDLVLDPFVGTGTTIAAAARLGRMWLGIDINPIFVEIAEQRVRRARLYRRIFQGEA